MAYCSNVETSEESTSEGPTARLRSLYSYIEKKEAKSRSYRRGQDRGELRGRDQKQRDLDESEREARQSHVC